MRGSIPIAQYRMAGSDVLSSDLRQLPKVDSGLRVNPDAIAQLLRSSVCPAPLTVYEGVQCKQPEYRYYRGDTSGQSEFSVQKLLLLLTRSVAENMSDILMMSAGKDSLSIALAVREAGNNAAITAVTYDDHEAGEGRIAAQFCAQLGIKHHIIRCPQDPVMVRDAMTRFFTHSPHPNCDPTIIPYILALNAVGADKAVIMDGTGNDGYSGLVPTRNQRRMIAYQKLARQAQGIGDLLPGTSGVQKFFSPYILSCLYGHAHLRERDIHQFLEYRGGCDAFWNGAFDDVKHRHDQDVLGEVISRYFDGSSVMLKGLYTAQSMDCGFVLPWFNYDIAEYVFNLPNAKKFDLTRRINKLPVRRMLRHYLDYDDAVIGKRIFAFDRVRFWAVNQAFIRDEILSCSYWKPAIERVLKDMEASPQQCAGAMVDLFLVSGWLNHCRYLKQGEVS